MQIKYISYPPGRPRGLFRKAVTLVAMIALAILALMFTAVLLPILLFVVLTGGAYLWWKTRAVRRQFREMQARMRQMHESVARDGEPQVFSGEVFEGDIIEGEAVRVHESGVSLKR